MTCHRRKVFKNRAFPAGRQLSLWIYAAVISLLSHSAAADWKEGEGYRARPLTVPSGGKPGFTLLPQPATGIAFTNHLHPDRSITNQIHLNGSGVALGDIDGDGLADIYFCRLDGPNVLYRNLGNWKFEDITEQAGVACANLDSTAAVFADLDGDGHLDLVVNTIGQGTHLFLNDGKGRFTKSPLVLNLGMGGMSMALADIDGDGHLDLYITNYRTWTIRDRPNTRLSVNFVDGKPIVERVDGRPVTDPELVGRFTLDPNGKIIENGEVDVLYRNDGNGKFTAIPFGGDAFLDEDGKPLAELPFEWGLSVMFRDINGNGLPDLYVCNDFRSIDRIWMNLGNGRFQAIPRLALRNTSFFSMGVDFSDVNRDGWDEFFVADMLSRDHSTRQVQVGDLMPTFLKIGETEDRPQYSRNTLFLNRSDGTYAEIGQFSGVDASEWSWTPVFLDVDLDGYEDLLITTGHERDAMNADVSERAEKMKNQRKLSKMELLRLNDLFDRLAIPNVAFRNLGNMRFEDVSASWGFDTTNVSHGMAVADLDGDGDLDVVINNLNDAAGIYRNDTSAPRVAVRLKGKAPNTYGIGARIELHGGAVPLQSQEMISGGRYLSGDEAMRVFAAGSLTNSMRLEVRWRSGLLSIIENVRANELYEIDEAFAKPAPPKTASAPAPLFEDVSHLISHTHAEPAFDDFARQPLLPNRLSQAGPGVSWHDVDGDGWEDLIIGSGRGGKLAVYRNDGQGGFTLVNDPLLQRPVARDQTTVLGLDFAIIAGSCNYEDGVTNGGAIRIYDLQRKAAGDSLLGHGFARGPLALADVDGDGALDLFVGGRAVPGRYPEPATSILFRNEGGRFVAWQTFENIGMVSGAVFSDLDGDGAPELILACQWGPIRIFRNEGGKLVPWDAPVTFNAQPSTLNQLTGWWNGVATGDFTGDGRMDIVASNWGLNSRYQTSQEHPRRMYYGDLDGSGLVSIIEAFYNPAMRAYVPERGLKSAAMAFPWLPEKIGSFEAYGKASVGELYGPALESLKTLEVTTLETMLFINRGGRFEARPLPVEAQLAPAFGISVADFDGDGNEDLFLSQNFFATHLENSRCDAGRGLLLRGDGRGGFTAVEGQHSGIKVYGEQRGCAVSDFDGDGRVDLVVTQNGAETKLYRNISGKPGLRIRLKGEAGNRTAVGAALRMKQGEQFGPMREIRAGSGYWSQDGAVQVLAMREEPAQLWVRWPGGRVTESDIPPGAREVEVGSDGRVRKAK